MHTSKFRVGALAAILALSLLRAGTQAAAAEPSDYTKPALGPREPNIRVEFPGGARSRAASSGMAYVSVFVGADGKARDVLVIGYTDRAFGRALEEKVRTLDFSPAKLKGQPVPGAFDIAYKFEIGDASISILDSAAQRGTKTKMEYQITPEKKLDGRLELASVSLPRLPAGYPAPEGGPVRVPVSFFIDEEGRVRCPSVETAPNAELATLAVDSVVTWTFKPPTSKGKPVLTVGKASVRFLPAAAAAQ